MTIEINNPLSLISLKLLGIGFELSLIEEQTGKRLLVLQIDGLIVEYEKEWEV